MTDDSEDRVFSTFMAFFVGLIVFGIGGLSMCLAYGGGWSTDASPAPWWTLVIILVPSLLATIPAYIVIRRVTR